MNNAWKLLNIVKEIKTTIYQKRGLVYILLLKSVIIADTSFAHKQRSLIEIEPCRKQN